jgi:photosystem II stability/assembly factor-like uncharacterized protein
MSMRERYGWAFSALTMVLPGLGGGCRLCPPCPADTALGAAQAGGGAESAGPVTNAPYVWKNVTILGGGFVTGIIFSPVEKDLIYARTDVGGAYRWNPADKTWIPITDQISRADANFWGIDSIAADPVDPKRVYMAVGTYTQSWAGNGAMLRSNDQGNTWERTDMSIKMGGNENGRGNGERLVVDPNQPSNLFFGSRKNGLWKSTDSGKGWNKVEAFPVGEEPLGAGITFVLFDQKSGASGKPTPIVYAGYASTQTGLYQSADAGASWKPVPKQPPGLMPSHAGLDANGLLYLSYGNLPGPSDVTTGAVYKYDPKKETWTDITPLAPKEKDNDKFGYGGLTVDPNKAGTVMVTTIDRWTKGDEIFRTIDGGANWTAIGLKAVRDDAGAKYLFWDKDKPSAVGWMADIDLDPHNPGRAIYVTGQGIWHSDDVTQADSDQPTHWVFRNRGLEETVVTDLVSPPVGPPLLSTVGDLCGFRHDDLSQPPAKGMFKNPLCWSGSSLDFAAKKPEIMVRAGQDKEGKRGAYSLDAGITWTPFPTEPRGGKGSGVVTVSADGTTILWASRDAKLAYSRDRGKTWNECNGLPQPSQTPDWAPVSLRPLADKVNAQKFYAYEMKEGQIYASTDGGATFVAGHAGLPTLADYQLVPVSFESVPGVEGDVWITTGKELYRSKDSGKTYEVVPTVTESYGVGFGKAPAGKNFPAVFLIAKVGDVTGIFRSDDVAETWIRINDDQHRFSSSSLIIGDPRVFGRAYVGTPGRGILYGDPQ